MTEEVAPYKITVPEMSDTPGKVLKPGPDWSPWTKVGAPGEVRKFMVSPDGYDSMELTPAGWRWSNAVVLKREGDPATREEAAQWSVPG